MPGSSRTKNSDMLPPHPPTPNHQQEHRRNSQGIGAKPVLSPLAYKRKEEQQRASEATANELVQLLGGAPPSSRTASRGSGRRTITNNGTPRSQSIWTPRQQGHDPPKPVSRFEGMAPQEQREAKVTSASSSSRRGSVQPTGAGDRSVDLMELKRIEKKKMLEEAERNAVSGTQDVSYMSEAIKYFSSTSPTPPSRSTRSRQYDREKRQYTTQSIDDLHRSISPPQSPIRKSTRGGRTNGGATVSPQRTPNTIDREVGVAKEQAPATHAVCPDVPEAPEFHQFDHQQSSHHSPNQLPTLANLIGEGARQLLSSAGIGLGRSAGAGVGASSTVGSSSPSTQAVFIGDDVMRKAKKKASSSASSALPGPSASAAHVHIPSQIPVEYYVYEQSASPMHVTDGTVRRLLFPSPKPTSRAEVYALADAMDKMTTMVETRHGVTTEKGIWMGGTGRRNKEEFDVNHDSVTDRLEEALGNNAVSKDFLCVVDVVFAEIVRQVMATCIERGLLLQHVRECIFSNLQQCWRNVDDMHDLNEDMAQQTASLKNHISSLETHITELTERLEEFQEVQKRQEKVQMAQTALKARDAVVKRAQASEVEEQELTKKISEVMEEVRSIKRSPSFAPAGFFMSTKMNANNNTAASTTGEEDSSAVKRGRGGGVYHPPETSDRQTDTEDLELYADGSSLFGRAARVQEKKDQAAKEAAEAVAVTARNARRVVGFDSNVEDNVSGTSTPAKKKSSAEGSENLGLPKLEINPSFTFGGSDVDPDEQKSISREGSTVGQIKASSDTMLARLRRGMSIRNSLHTAALSARNSIRSRSASTIKTFSDQGVTAKPKTRSRETQCFMRQSKVKTKETDVQCTLINNADAEEVEFQRRLKWVEADTQTNTNVKIIELDEEKEDEDGSNDVERGEGNAACDTQPPSPVKKPEGLDSYITVEAHEEKLAAAVAAALARVAKEATKNKDEHSTQTTDSYPPPGVEAQEHVAKTVHDFHHRRVQTDAVEQKSVRSQTSGPTVPMSVGIIGSDDDLPSPRNAKSPRKQTQIDWDGVNAAHEKKRAGGKAGRHASKVTSVVSPTFEQVLAKLNFKAAKRRPLKWVVNLIMDIHNFVIKEKGGVTEGLDLQELTIATFKNKYGLDKMSESYLCDFIFNAKQYSSESTRIRAFATFAHLWSYLSIEPDGALLCKKGYAFYQYMWSHFRRQATRPQLQAATNGAITLPRSAISGLLDRILQRYLPPEHIAVVELALFDAIQRYVQEVQARKGVSTPTSDGGGSAGESTPAVHNEDGWHALISDITVMVLPYKGHDVVRDSKLLTSLSEKELTITQPSGSAFSSNNTSSADAVRSFAHRMSGSGLSASNPFSGTNSRSGLSDSETTAGSNSGATEPLYDLDVFMQVLCRNYDRLLHPICEECLSQGVCSTDAAHQSEVHWPVQR